MSKFDLFCLAFGITPYLLAFILRRSIKVHVHFGQHRSKRFAESSSGNTPRPLRSDALRVTKRRLPSVIGSSANMGAADSVVWGDQLLSALINLKCPKPRARQIVMKVQTSMPGASFDEQLRQVLSEAGQEKAA